jgi:hypothetical protein
MDIAIILSVIAVVVAVVVPFTVEALKRPQLEIKALRWSSSGPTRCTFAAVVIRNKPLWALLSRLLARHSAEGCVADIDYFRWGTGERVLDTVPGRWTSHQEPIRSLPHTGEAPAPGSGIDGDYHAHANIYDPTLDPREQDIAVSSSGEEVRVAILRDGKAYAFSTESFAYDSFGNPKWALDHGTYRVEVSVHGSGVGHKRSFKLEYFSDDFSRFRLQEI